MTCGNCELDAQQIDSVVACEDAQLVLASAGSGKTLSLLAKIEYLNRQLNIPANQILAISFTQKTVVELKERCSVKNVEIRTFHSLGNSILAYAENQNSSKRILIQETESANFIRVFCEYLINHDKQFARDVVDYLLFFISTPQSLGNIQSFAKRISINKMYLRRALANKSNEHIRAKDEQLIANWLYIHNLQYAHAQKYPYSESNYQPTFTLKTPQAIYVDYVYMDEKGKSSQGSNYLRDIK